MRPNCQSTKESFDSVVDSLELNETDATVYLYCGIGTLSLLMAKARVA